MKTAVLRARIEPDLKTEAETILSQLGINPTQAVTMLYRQVVMIGGLPFDVRVPNALTRKTFEDTDRGIGLRRHKSAQAMLRELKGAG
jgi:DNA-damage-inducible protein J